MQLINRIINLGVILILAWVLASCQKNTNGVQIEAAWARALPQSATSSAFYMKIINTGSQGDMLISASSPGCGVIEIHATGMDGDTMSMHPVSGGGVEIPAGEVAELKTGGMHLMCIEKKVEFTAGATIPLTLQFEQAGAISLDVEVRNP